ncbi:sugar-binding domain-containing protein [Cognataquiflexum rubidum]|uniref:sugar-binding domain-containing protein n=1 Tax=Cognataquiflexum rubidum TaxID=2922273 RepID=UPI001F131957|nr:sugar-binding domain-containing protein [Cognataquiflexum rubidum]MCH6235586.1 fibronectin type III domain-containing protein [Cognataquiflexum rubidum]
MKANLFNLFLLVLISLYCSSNFAFSQIKKIDSFLDLNGTWSFKIDPHNSGLENQWYQLQDSNNGAWDKMEVPGNWDLRNEYAHYTGKAWYQKTFELPSDWKNKNIKIHFEAVSHDATVWVNGKMIGINDSGFLPFEFDLTPFLQPGQVNNVTLLVDNTKKTGAIWNWGGIRRPVHLSGSDGIRLTGYYVTPIYDYRKNSATVHYRLKFKNHTAKNSDVKGEIQIKKEGVLIKKIPFVHQTQANSENEILLSTKLDGKQVKAWHFDSPHLYHSEVIFNDSDIPAGVQRFGLRTVELDESKKQLLLNGESIRAMGFNLVPDDRTTGNTLPLWRIKEDIDLMKEAGGNLARLSHLPLPKEALDYMDERGIMTFSEIPLWGFDPLADPNSKVSREWLIRLIDSQYNHPCIIGWNVGNEIGDYPETYKYVQQAIDLAKSLDSTRLATAVSHTAQRPNDFLVHSDLGLINKYGSNLLPVTETQHNNFPNKILFYSEYGIAQFGEDLNSDFDAKSLIDPLRNLDYLIGASLWTFNDYRSNYNGTKEFSENRSWGVVDVYRRKKRAYYSIRKEHAPVKNLTVSSISDRGAEISIIPRDFLDLPSFALRNYRLLWRIMDIEGEIQESGWENLPEIIPGSPTLKRRIDWKSGEGHKLEVVLLTPQNDNVVDASVYFKTPKIIPPIGIFGGRKLQNDIRPKSATIRVFLDENPTADFHAAKVKIGNGEIEIGPTFENFLDIADLEFSTPYELEVFAVNSAGKTLILKHTIEIDPKKIIPPAIRHIEATKNGFFVGYATEADDFQFRVRYAKEKYLEKNSKTITTTNPGLIFIPIDNAELPYHFQIQRVKDNNFYSDWSTIYDVPFDQIPKPKAPKINGVTRQKGEALVHFDPVAKAIGYDLEYRDVSKKDAVWSRVSISKSLAEYVLIEGLNPKSDYEFRISTITLGGKSDYSAAIQK